MTAHYGRPIVRLDTSLERLSEYASVHDTGGPVLATVVATEGSTYRKSGARMIILVDGSYFGLLSGGCLEGDLKIHADSVRTTGVPQIIAYDMRGLDDVLYGMDPAARAR